MSAGKRSVIKGSQWNGGWQKGTKGNPGTGEGTCFCREYKGWDGLAGGGGVVPGEIPRILKEVFVYLFRGEQGRDPVEFLLFKPGCDTEW